MVSTRVMYHYAIRAVKKRAEAIKAQKLLEASQESVVTGESAGGDEEDPGE